MNDRSGEVRAPETPAFELPPDSSEQGWEKALEKAKEADVGQDQAVKQSKKQQASQTSVTLSVDDPSIIQTGDDSAVADDSADSASHETEVVEKHWVERAKSVLARYGDNPHKQKAELSKVKAEYLKVRFNKILKVEEAG